MNVLLLGSGGREHAIAWKLAQSPLLTELFIAPGNAGTAQVGTNLPFAATDFEALKFAIIEKNITLVIVGPEDPLVKGVHDFVLADAQLQAQGVKVLGPQQYAATLEGSKEFAKQFMIRNAIPTAAHFTATAENLQESFAFLEQQQSPYVLKADGLAAGKGVLIIPDLETAKQELQAMLQGKFGAASRKVVIEECLHGIEMSVFVLTDGKDYVILPEAKDYKRVGEGDTGLNTGGMGAVSPVPFAGEALMQRIEREIVKPTIDGFHKENIPYCGFVFIGLMVNNGVPKVIEYNVRMGDPETEVVIPRINSDLLQLCHAAATQNLAGQTIDINPQTATTVMLVSGGYPQDYESGKHITITGATAPSLVFHAGTKRENEELSTAGGRVIAVTSLADSKNNALALSYQAISNIHFDAMYFRRDIGFDL
ncbi:MAG: phosphoribosylamine--glycine ligase [Bacteroidales bacterium]|jgi:phosphoribosylamine--glycine ligase|nr:phosphoribosylamine--glycine ligase [Bacteroidales bacterium]